MNCLILFADIFDTTALYKKNKESFLKKWNSLTQTACQEFQMYSFGSMSQVITIYDNIWVRINADNQSSAISPDDNVLNLFPDLLKFSKKLNDAALKLPLKMVQAIAFGKIEINEDALAYAQHSTTGQPINLMISSLGDPHFFCAEFFKKNNKKCPLPDNSIWVHKDVLIEDNSIEGINFYFANNCHPQCSQGKTRDSFTEIIFKKI